MKNEIYKNLLKLETLEEIANHAEADYEKEPENREFEETFDRAYKNEFAAFMAVSGQIAKFAGVDEKTARAMVKGRREELKRILTIHNAGIYPNTHICKTPEQAEKEWDKFNK